MVELEEFAAVAVVVGGSGEKRDIRKWRTLQMMSLVKKSHNGNDTYILV